MTFLKAFLADLVKLKLPVTAAATVATVLALAQPFGISLGGDTTAKVAGALVAIGIIAAYVQDKLGGVVVQTNPATLPALEATSFPADGVERVATVSGRRPASDPAAPRPPGAG